MTREEFQTLVRKGPLLLDGATGSNLWKRGMPAGVCPEKWVLEHPEELLGLQKEFLEAGSQILYAPTFSANRIKLAEYGLAGGLEEMNRELVALSRRAAGGRALVAGDLTMTGKQLAPIGSLDFEELIGIYQEQIRCLVQAGADLLVIETMMSLQEARAALIAAKEACDLPVMVTMTFEADGRTLYGTDPLTAAVVLESLGASAVGANCSTGPEQMRDMIAQMAAAVNVPVIAKPNAGLPVLDAEGNTVYPMEPEEFASGMEKLLEAGAGILGGCCGTTPAHIGALAQITEARQAAGPEIQEGKGTDHRDLRYLTSERRTVAFSLQDPLLLVGERINPTGKKKLQEQLRQGELDMVARFAEEQEACGASVLDINMGMGGIDEKAMMLAAVEEVTSITSLPLSLDSSHVEVLEAALRRYPGRALVNSVSCEKEKMAALLPLVRKYGAMFILLPLSEAGLPKNQEEKRNNIETVIREAKRCGLTEKDIVVDGLVATVGANPAAALETLETIRYCKERGLATICGLSNISFGLPERGYINSAFLTLALREGLTMAIANPSQDLLAAMAFAADLLLHKEGGDIRYIEKMNALREKREREGAVSPTAGKQEGNAFERGERREYEAGNRKEDSLPAGEKTAKHQKDGEIRTAASCAAGLVREAVLKGNRRHIGKLTEAALQEGIQARDLLDGTLLPAINEVGDLFDQGIYFLPQLIGSAEAMKASIELLEPYLARTAENRELPTVVIATVKGDIHDIGKNLVALMLRNYGFEVVDLGKDVDRETIVEAAIAHKAQIIALSALMTTTMQEMKQVVALAKERGVTAKIMIGGAVITQEYADEIQADGYSRDAAEAVKLARRLLGI